MASEEQKKQDLQGWGMIFAVRQDVLNKGLQKLHDKIPEEYQSINYQHTVVSPLTGDIVVKVSDAELGVIQVAALREGLKLTKVLIPFDSGTVTFEALAKVVEDLKGATIDATISLVQFKAVIQPKDATRYDIHLQVESDDAVYDVNIDINPLYNEFINSLVKSMFKGIGGKSYYICSFDVGKDFTFKDYIPTEMDYTFIFDETNNDNSVFCALMSTADKPAPTVSTRYSFNRLEVLPENQVAALSIHNSLFLSMLVRNLKSRGQFQNATWIIEGDSPASINLEKEISDFKDGADLQKCSISAKQGRIYVNMTLYKADVTPGINLLFKSETKLMLVWDEAKQDLTLQVDGDPTLKHDISESLWLTIVRFIPNIYTLLITNIIIFIIEALIRDNIPDIGSTISSELSSFKVPVTLPKVFIQQGIIIKSVQINEYGSITAGIGITEEN